MRGSGNRMRELRQTKKLSQVRLAHLVGTSQQQIQRIETGLQTARIDLALKIANELGASLAEAFPGLQETQSVSDLPAPQQPTTEAAAILLPESALARLSPATRRERAAELRRGSGPQQPLKEPAPEDEDLYVSLDLERVRRLLDRLGQPAHDMMRTIAEHQGRASAAQIMEAMGTTHYNDFARQRAHMAWRRAREGPVVSVMAQDGPVFTRPANRRGSEVWTVRSGTLVALRQYFGLDQEDQPLASVKATS